MHFPGAVAMSPCLISLLIWPPLAASISAAATPDLPRRIAEMPQEARFLFGQHFKVGQRRMQNGIPVHEALAAIDEALIMQSHEYFGDRVRHTLIHRETITTPGQRRTHAFQLVADLPARLILPFPDAPDELVAPEIFARTALGVQLAFDNHLSRDTGVVHARLPERIAPQHPVVAGKRVHDRILKRVAHMQRARDIGRRNHDAIRPSVARLPAIGFEVSAGFPARVLSLFDLFWLV